MQSMRSHGLSLCATRVVYRHKVVTRWQNFPSSSPQNRLPLSFGFADHNNFLIPCGRSTWRKNGLRLLVGSKVKSAPVVSDRVHALGSPEFVDGLLGSQQPGEEKSGGLSDLIFLGTGTSEGVPRVSCLTHTSKRCPVCWEAVQTGNKNRRRNTSLMLRFASADGSRKNILIDAGLDDLRDWTNNVQDVVKVFIADRDIQVVAKTHYYLVDTSVVTKGTAVSKLKFELITEEPFDVLGLKVIPLPVWHGKDYRSLGFRVGNICYISDVSEIPKETYKLLENCDLLILDALRPDRSSTTHFGLPQALEEVRKIQPKRTLFTGMMHTMDHEIINKELAKLGELEGLDMQLSYDGMRIPITL